MSTRMKKEQRVDLEFWMQNGAVFPHRGHGKGLPEVSIGRTDSERGLGFLLLAPKTKKVLAAFVLDRTQVENLHAYLGGQIDRLKTMKWPSVLNLAAMAKMARRQQAAALGRRRARQRARRRAGGSQ